MRARITQARGECGSTFRLVSSPQFPPATAASNATSVNRITEEKCYQQKQTASRGGLPVKVGERVERSPAHNNVMNFLSSELEPGAASPIDQARRASCISTSSSRRNSRVLQNDLLLHEAVIKNEPDAVRKILKEPVDVNSRNNYGRAPIHWAASRGSTEVMEMLINAKCDIEAQDRYGMRALLMAAWHGHRDAVEMLINCGASVLAVNKKQYTLLICAAKNCRLDVINFLLDTLEDVNVDEGDIDNQTAVFHAAAGGHLEVVKRLLDVGANPNAKNKTGRTPLHAAAERGHLDVVEFLVDREADMTAKDTDGNTALHLATENKQTSVVQLLLEHGSPTEIANEKGLTSLHIACHLGCKGMIDSFIHYGSNINSQSKTGNTSLHFACQSNELEIVENLIENGAEVNVLNSKLQSAMHIAAEQGFTDICKVLLTAGANVQQKEQSGKTALYIAARGSFTAIVDMIIKTSRLDYPVQDDENGEESNVQAQRRLWDIGEDKPDVPRECNEKLRSLLYRMAHKQLGPGDWKRLAMHWAFTEDQIHAIEHQYTGPASYREHGFRMLLIWAHGLSPDVNPVKELYESLVAIDKKKIADALRKKLDQDNESHFRKNQPCCRRCSVQ